ncbi:MAG TPA: MoaD/ThiS family protein [Clostridiales bacterium]|nr:MoaD/ThiS family protein [Clostridiales bacterium]
MEENNLVTVEFFGLYRLAYKKACVKVEAKNIEELFQKLYEMDDVHTPKELRNSIVLLNGKNIMELRKFKTKLKPNDNVVIMSPASGG